jgi:hypothetical protein
VAQIDIDFWQSRCNNAGLKRRIPIDTMQQNLVMIFNQQELQSLKRLIFLQTKKSYQTLTASEIDHTIILN